ncbi:hypothetical protein NEK97_02330 [Paenarthrobacter sp. UW852]|uniref:hypothetical protein n=1 Tax=Paenarthrobacter sp. UW852 TaxID=2951989 RepID=UPI002148B2BE|nr:hypothetical protein [Paenarthrobacter sp. UW852]MCR1160297.1 hypothetical protein [Paenarthrobacter sp. UW852]
MDRKTGCTAVSSHEPDGARGDLLRATGKLKPAHYSPSNVKESSTASRKIALGHALLSYFFATFVVAVAINLVVSQGQSG